MAEQVDDLARHRLLLALREGARERAVVVPVQLPRLGDERHQLFLHALEDDADLRCLHAPLVVVEQHVVRLVGLGEQLDIAAAQLEVVLEVRAERLEVVRRAREAPRHEALGARLDDLGPQVGRDPDGLVEVLAGHADQRCVVGVRVERVLVGGELFEQPPRVGGREDVVGDAVERGLLLAAGARTGRGHHHLHVPAEDPADATDVGDLREPGLQLLECLGRGHEAEAYSRTTAGAGLDSALVVGKEPEHEGLREPPVTGVERNGDAVVVSLAGELDLYNAEAVRTVLLEECARRPERVVVDLSRVEFIDSTALGVLIEARTKLENHRGFLLASPAVETRRALEISGLDRHFGHARHARRRAYREALAASRATIASAPAAATTPSARSRTSPSPRPCDAEQQCADAGRGGHDADRERPDAASRRLDRRVRELSDRQQRSRDERRAQVDLAAVEQRDRVPADRDRERELKQRPPATGEANRERDERNAAGNREWHAEEIGLERRPGTDRREEQQRSRCGQRALRA